MKKSLLTIFAVIFILIATGNSFGQITSAKSGDWGAAATWAGGVVPGATDDVIIAATDTVTFSTATAEVNNLTIRGVLYFSKTVRLALTVNGNILIEK